MDSSIKRGLLAAFWAAIGFSLRAVGTFCGLYLALKLHGGVSGIFVAITVAMAFSLGYPVLRGFIDGFFRAPSGLELAGEIVAIPLIWVAGGYYLFHSDYLLANSPSRFVLTAFIAGITGILFVERTYRIGHYRPMRISWFG